MVGGTTIGTTAVGLGGKTVRRSSIGFIPPPPSPPIVLIDMTPSDLTFLRGYLVRVATTGDGACACCALVTVSTIMVSLIPYNCSFRTCRKVAVSICTKSRIDTVVAIEDNPDALLTDILSPPLPPLPDIVPLATVAVVRISVPII